MNQVENNKLKVYRTYGYVRLSNEDGDKAESNSITNQKELLRNYFASHPELQECGMEVDDGYSGSNFVRPGFEKLMEAVKAGLVDCIVVKDLSRFGRNYLETGEYLEKIFPRLNVRFISIGDHYDSADWNIQSCDFIIPFINLVNEAYCGDISRKIRSQLEIKRKNGDFIGPFAAYGYLKSPEDKHKLIVDEYASGVVQSIFKWKLEGIGTADIADMLNERGILSPSEYKRSIGLNYVGASKKLGYQPWTVFSVLKILKNPIYIGVLEQGKVTTPSYKVKKLVHKPKSEWIVIEDNHTAIINKLDFESVQKVLSIDTRTRPGGKKVELFSGMVYCAECGASMIRKTIPYKDKKYIYYVCSNQKQGCKCTSKGIRDNKLADIVLDSLQKYINDVVNLENIISQMDKELFVQAKEKKLQLQIEKKQKEVDHYQILKQSLHESLMDGIIDKAEYMELKQRYSEKYMEVNAQLKIFQQEAEKEAQSQKKNFQWIEQVKQYLGIKELERSIIVTLIDHILIYPDKQIKIIYRFQDEYKWFSETILTIVESPFHSSKEVC